MYPRCSLATGALALLATFPSLTVLAAEQALPTVVVTATRQPQRSNELLADVSTISREDIEAAGQTSLPELLARLDDRKVGDVVVLSVERAGKSREVQVELQPGI